MWAKGRMDLIR